MYIIDNIILFHRNKKPIVILISYFNEERAGLDEKDLCKQRTFLEEEPASLKSKVFDLVSKLQTLAKQPQHSTSLIKQTNTNNQIK